MTEPSLHATCVEFLGAGLLLRGPSGAGKSDLALRLIEAGARLVADDRTVVTAEEGRLVARAPDLLRDRIEVRGIGILTIPALKRTALSLVVDLVAPDEVDRLPEPNTAAIEGIALPRILLDPFAASALAKLRLAVAQLRGPIMSRAEWSGERTVARSAGRKDGGERRTKGKQPVVLLTGMAGAGRSTALKVLEDVGYEAIDNLPLPYLDPVIQEARPRHPIAIGIDTRTRAFAVQPVLDEIDRLMSDASYEIKLVFLDCDDEVLVRRYTETRRRHPLAQGRPVLDGIQAERRLLAPLRGRADLTLDTSVSTPAELRRFLQGHFGLERSAGLAIFVTSFSFRNGLPREADLVFDVRFLSNPHYDPVLRPLTGLDPAVVAHVEADPGYAAFFTHLQELIGPLLPRYEAEGKSYLTIAIGCTGGRHRSVAVTENLARWLRASGREVSWGHRDLTAETRPDGVELTAEPKLPASEAESDVKRQGNGA